MTNSRLAAAVGGVALVLAAAAAAKSFPDVIQLPNGWRPEGIEAGKAAHALRGLIPAGAVRQMDARTGESFTLVQPTPGRSATGLEHDQQERAAVRAGGGTGRAYVYDAETGAPHRRLPAHARRCRVHQRRVADEGRRLLHRLAAALVLPPAARRRKVNCPAARRWRRSRSRATTCTATSTTSTGSLRRRTGRR